MSTSELTSTSKYSGFIYNQSESESELYSDSQSDYYAERQYDI